jgi:hypothetical protein
LFLGLGLVASKLSTKELYCMANLILSLYLGLLLLLSQKAFAYLDPGNGSMLLQLLLGGAAGVGVLGKYFWRNIATFFSFKKKDVLKPSSDKEM